jgi:hypothetical protein
LISLLNHALTKEKNPQTENTVKESELVFADTDFDGDFEPEPDLFDYLKGFVNILVL